MKKLAELILLIFLLFIAPSTADIKSVKIRSDDRHSILFQEFGFTKTGQLSISVSSVSVTSVPVSSSLSQPDLSRMGFFLVPDIFAFNFGFEDFCNLDSSYIKLLFKFTDLSNHSTFNKTFPITFPDKYSLYFTNCNSYAFVTMDVHTEMYNVENGNTKNYLSASLTALPGLYLVFSVIYLCISILWVFLCIKNRSSFRMYHLVMGALIVMKVVNCMYAAEDRYHLKVTGTRHKLAFFNVLFNVVQLIRALVLLIVMKFLLFKKSFSEGKLIKKITITITVLGIVVCVMMEETGPFFMDWGTWVSMSNIVDFICFGVMALPIWYSMEFEYGDSDWRKSSSFLVAKAWLVFIAFVVFGRFIIWLIIDFLVSYKYWWLFNAFGEIVILVLYTMIVKMAWVIV